MYSTFRENPSLTAGIHSEKGIFPKSRGYLIKSLDSGVVKSRYACASHITIGGSTRASAKKEALALQTCG
jgi:hypothetical protein